MDFINWYRRYALVSFFVLTYAITWGAVLAISLPERIQGQALAFESIMMVFGAVLAGPAFSALALTAAGGGEPGIQALAAYLARWRVGLHWYLAALLTAPLLVLGVLLSLTALVSPQFAPVFVPAGIAIGLLTGLFGEIGWTGFALPHLRQRFSPLVSGLLLGLLLSFWHMAADFAGSRPGLEGYWIASFLLYWLAPLTAYRVLMVWVHQYTRSLLLMQIMHAAYTGALFALRPPMEPELALIYAGALTAAFWLAAGLVLLITRGALARPPARIAPVA